MAPALMPDEQRLADLAEFSRIEMQSGDVEPWAEMIRALIHHGRLTREEGLWVTKLYNAYDDLGSAWAVFRRWPGPLEWAEAPDRYEAADYPCTQERRNLRGGRINQHLESYAGHLRLRQEPWLTEPLDGDPEADFHRLTAHVRTVWGTGRQSAFEWVEFLGKANGFPVTAAHGDLWDSSGPRRALERLYGNSNPTPDWLDEAAMAGRSYLAESGVNVSWEDFETLICDYNVMRDGRYYPGRHLAALREEIESTDPEDREWMEAAWHDVVPPEWQHIEAGIRKDRMPVYRDTGHIRSHP